MGFETFIFEKQSDRGILQKLKVGEYAIFKMSFDKLGARIYQEKKKHDKDFRFLQAINGYVVKRIT